MISKGTIVVPGDKLGTIREVKPSQGTYVKAGIIYASIRGTFTVQDENLATVTGNKAILSFSVPKVGQIVLARVLRITTQQAFVSIVAIEGVGLLSNAHEGVIRQEDVRSSGPVKIQESFLPGDIVICRVLDLGDVRRYSLTTTETHLGVLHAKSATSGQSMVAVSWKEMECTQTGKREPRKCARPKVDLSGE